MMKILLSAAMVVGAGSAFANELDREGSVTNRTLKGTVVVRVDKRNKSVSMLQVNGKIKSSAEAKVLAKKSRFKRVPSSKIKHELDRDGGASSWYWYCNPYNYSYNSLNWYGYQYRPYYSYNYGYYNYYYYNQWNGWGGYGNGGYGNGGGYGGPYGYTVYGQPDDEQEPVVDQEQEQEQEQDQEDLEPIVTPNH